MLIKNLSLQSAEINNQKQFYTQVLRCTLIEEAKTYFEIAIGETRLRFEENADATPYHFAINIPSNQVTSALKWLKERLDILPAYGEEIVDFSSWRAFSVYFYDRDRNIVELIARERIGIVSRKPFDAEQMINVSEIGLPVKDLRSTYHELINLAGRSLPVFSGSFDVFCAIGDDNGLFIVIDSDKKDWFPAGDVAKASDFQISGVENGKTFDFKFEKGKVVRIM